MVVVDVLLAVLEDALLIDEAELDAEELEVLLLEVPPLPTVIVKSFDAVLLKPSVATRRITRFSLTLGAVTVKVEAEPVLGVAVLLVSVTTDHA